MIVIDTHCDTPERLISGADIVSRGNDGHFDFERMDEGGVDCEFFALYTPNDMPPDAALRRVMEMMAVVKDSVASYPKAKLAYSAEDVMENKRRGQKSIAIGIENAAPLGKSLSLLREMYRMGARYVTLTHNGNNEICDAALAGERKWNGLSPFGREFVAEMNRIGMMVDISHVSDETFYDVLSVSTAPVIASHSCCRALSGRPRNLDDRMLKALAGNGGVVQINFYPLFLDAATVGSLGSVGSGTSSMPAFAMPSYKKVVDHIEHAVEIAGIGNVGIGSDFDGIGYTPAGLEDISKLPVIWEELSSRGYGDKEISMIAGGNFLRVWKAVEDSKTLELQR